MRKKNIFNCSLPDSAPWFGCRCHHKLVSGLCRSDSTEVTECLAICTRIHCRQQCALCPTTRTSVSLVAWCLACMNIPLTVASRPTVSIIALLVLN